jgi:hypothetical protein
MMKTLYILAWCMFVAAIVLDFCGKTFYSRAATGMARATMIDQEERLPAIEEAHAAARSADCFAWAGMIFAGLGLVFWVASMVKGKNITLIPFLLFVAYIMLFLLMV